MPYKIPSSLMSIKTIRMKNGMLEGKVDQQGRVYWFKDGKYITPYQMQNYKYYDPAIKGYRKLGDKAKIKPFSKTVEFVDIYNPVYTPTYDKLLNESNRKEYENHKREEQQNIPLQNQKWITLRTNGKMNLVDIPENMLDSIAVNAGRSGTDFWTDAALVGKESTFTGFSKALGSPYSPTIESASVHEMTNNHAWFNTPEGDYIHASNKKFPWHEEKGRAEGERDMKYALEHGLVKETTPHYSNYILADAFKRYQTAPTQYNPGQKNYVPMLNDIRQELLGEKQLQEYWNTRGKQEYARGQREGMSYGGKMHIDPSNKETFTAPASSLFAKGGLLEPKDAWDRLSIPEKADIIKVGVKHGIFDLQELRRKYNEFKEGGSKEEEEEVNTIVPYTQRTEVVITPDTEYNQYLNTLPDNQRFTPNDKYDSYFYWKINGKPKNFEEAYAKGMFNYDHSDNGYHANSIAFDDNTGIGYFMKPKDHDTVGYELDWFNKGLVTEEGGHQRYMTPEEKKEWLKFRKDYTLMNDPNRPNYYMYQPIKHSIGGPLVDAANYRDENIYGLGDWLKKGFNWLKNAAQVAAIAENPSVMTAAGHRVTREGKAVQDRQNSKDVKQLRQNLANFGEGALGAMTATDDVEAAYNVLRHPVQTAKALKEGANAIYQNTEQVVKGISDKVKGKYKVPSKVQTDLGQLSASYLDGKPEIGMYFTSDGKLNSQALNKDLAKGIADARLILGSDVKAASDAHNIELAKKIGFPKFTPYKGAQERASVYIQPQLIADKSKLAGSLEKDINPASDKMTINVLFDADKGGFHETLHRGNYGEAGTSFDPNTMGFMNYHQMQEDTRGAL